MPPIISVEDLSKVYVIRHQTHERYTALRDILMGSVRRLLGAFRSGTAMSPTMDKHERFHALHDVNLAVEQGERVGVIGPNGAGKSTLLKLLSRITYPSKGRITLHGRVASLLEVGTGFHPELTGRENIFLNGAILGMTRAEIRRKFDEIVAFAEVEKFLDTPVKRYSSGMYVRLAFAVAAHLEPEILLVDEVLAVGDAQFQRKCLGKMEDVANNQGRTILFVSHNMQAIRRLCSRAVLLSGGRLIADGPTNEITDLYLRESTQGECSPQLLQKLIAELRPDPVFQLLEVNVVQDGRAVTGTIGNGSELTIGIRYRVFERTTGLRVYIDVSDIHGLLLFRSFSDEQHDAIPSTDPGVYESEVIIPANLLGPSHYMLGVSATIFNVRPCMKPGPVRTILSVEQTGRFNRAYLADTFRQKLAPVLTWTTRACHATAPTSDRLAFQNSSGRDE
jgi:lipopolysaccharide transport system ATP-binding protein